MTKKELIEMLNNLTDDDDIEVNMMGYDIASADISNDGKNDYIYLMDFAL